MAWVRVNTKNSPHKSAWHHVCRHEKRPGADGTSHARLSFLISRKPTCGQSIRGRGFGEFFLRPPSCRLRMASNASTGTVSYFSPSRQVGEVPSFLILRPPRGRDAGGDVFDSHNIIQGWLLWRLRQRLGCLFYDRLGLLFI